MKFTLITGASSGIGLAYAEQLAAKGENIVVVSNQSERNEEVAQMLKDRYRVEALPLYADLSNANSAQEIFDWCKEQNIEVDTLISNAGILQFSMFMSCTPTLIDKIIALHCTTPTKLCRLFGEDMCKRGNGRILMMSSISAWIPYPTISLYGSTKAYMKSFAQSLWAEMRQHGVRVTTVYPGAVDTPLYSLDEKYRKWLRFCGLMMRPEKLARAGIKAMERGRRAVTPGLFSKFAAFAVRILPAHTVLLIMKIPIVKRLLEKL